MLLNIRWPFWKWFNCKIKKVYYKLRCKYKMGMSGAAARTGKVRKQEYNKYKR